MNTSIVVIGGGLAGREAAKCANRLGADVALVTRSLDPGGRLDHTAIRFLAGESGQIAEAWEPEGPSPGPVYAPAMRETFVGALDIAADIFRNRMAELQDIGVRVIEGIGSIAATDFVRVTQPEGESEDIRCCAIVLAPGAEPFFGEPSPRVLMPSALSSLQEIPESLIVLGSSPSALELANFFAAYGVFVTVVGARRPVLDFLDADLRSEVVDQAADNQIWILTGVTAIAGTADGHIDILLSDDSHIDADYVLPCGEGNHRTDGLGLEGPGVRTDADGRIVVDEQMRTNIPEIFAVGTAAGGDTPAIAKRQAKVAAENAMGGESAVRSDLIPKAIWFNPEIGVVGLTEEQAVQAGFAVSAFAVCMDLSEERSAKVIADESTGRMVGLHMVGHGAVEAVHMGALAMHAGIMLSDIAEITTIAGTMSECVSEASIRGRFPLPEVVHPLVASPE